MTKLDTIDDIKRELSRVYDETRDGMIEAGTGVKLAQILQIAVKIVESCELEKRIDNLENKEFLTKEQRDAIVEEKNETTIELLNDFENQNQKIRTINKNRQRR